MVKAGNKIRIADNARAENFSRKADFQRSFSKRRCLIAAEGFMNGPKKKKTYYFNLQNRRPRISGICDEPELSATGKEASLSLLQPAQPTHLPGS